MRTPTGGRACVRRRVRTRACVGVRGIVPVCVCRRGFVPVRGFVSCVQSSPKEAKLKTENPLAPRPSLNPSSEEPPKSAFERGSKQPEFGYPLHPTKCTLHHAVINLIHWIANLITFSFGPVSIGILYRLEGLD